MTEMMTQQSARFHSEHQREEGSGAAHAGLVVAVRASAGTMPAHDFVVTE